MEKLTILGGGRYLPFARRMVQQLKRLNLPRASKVLVVDGVTIAVRIEPNFEHIRIQEEEPALYQFFTTGPEPAERALQQPGESLEDYLARRSVTRGYGVLVGVDKKTKELVGIPTGSTLEESTDTPPKWKYSADATAIIKFLPYYGFQIDGLPLHQYFPSTEGPRFVEATWTAAADAGDLSRSGAVLQYSALSDVGYDSPVSIVKRPGNPKNVAPDTDWYRRSAIARVNGRTFALLTDVSGVLHVCPTSDLDPTLRQDSPYLAQAIKTNVADEFTVRNQIPHPAWARAHNPKPARDALKDGDQDSDKPPHTCLRWMFNSTATRMVGIVAADMAYVTNGAAPLEPDFDGAQLPLREAVPGLLEVGIAIEVTGDDLADFTVTLEVLNEVKPADNRCIIAADYYWGDENIPLDTLLISEIDVYHDRQESAVDLEAPYLATTTMLAVKRFDTGEVLRTFTAHAADCPYGMRGMARGSSFLQIYNTEIIRQMNGMVNGITSPSVRAPVADLRDTFRDYATALLGTEGDVTPALVAEYEHTAQTCLDDMLASVNGSGYGDKPEFQASVLLAKSIMTQRLGQQIDVVRMWTSFLAYDLRVLAFATQSAYFSSTGDTVTRQDRLQIIMRNEVVHTEQPPGEDFAAMAAAYDAPFAPGDWVRLGVMETSNPAQSLFGFRLTRLTGTYRDDAGIPEARPSFNAEYPVGALAYNVRTQGVHAGDPFEVFCIHPAGHWSICTRPIITLTGPSKHVMPGRRSSFSPDAQTPDLSQVAQRILDVVSVRVIEKIDGQEEARDLKSSHRELFNQAYGKTYPIEDFYYTLENTQSSIGGIYRRSILFKPKAANMRTFGVDYGHLIYTMASSDTIVAFTAPANYADLHNYSVVTMGASTESNLESAAFKLTTVSPVMRGACLFGGGNKVKI